MKDDKISELKAAIETGKISQFKEIYDYVPRTNVANMIKVNAHVFREGRYNDPSLFTIKQVMILSAKLGVPFNCLTELIEKELKGSDFLSEIGESERTVSKEVEQLARKARRKFSTGKYKKIELANELGISRPTLNFYLSLDPKDKK